MENHLLNSSSGLNIVITVHKDLWLDDWDKTRLLDCTSVTSETPSILLKRKSRWSTIRGDLKDGSPLGKASTLCVVSGSTFLQAIKTSAPGFNWMSSRKWL